LPSAFYRALDKVLLLVTTTFTESRTLDIEKHSARNFLPSAEHSTNRDDVQFAELSLPNVVTLGKAFAECFTDFRHSAKKLFRAVNMITLYQLVSLLSTTWETLFQLHSVQKLTKELHEIIVAGLNRLFKSRVQ
jgi:hypothetical protein